MTLTAESPEVTEFVAAYQENRNLAHSAGPSSYRIVAIEKRKYINVDEIPTFEGRDCPGKSGRFMIDRADGVVYTIRGYGQRNHRIGTVTGLARDYRAGSASFRPDLGCHVENRYSRVATWGPIGRWRAS